MGVVVTGAGEQVLQAVRAGVADGLREHPAVDILQLHQQLLDRLPEGRAGLTAGKATGHNAHQVLEQPAVPVMRCRRRGGLPHPDVGSHLVMITAVVLVPGASPMPPTSTDIYRITIYRSRG